MPRQFCGIIACSLFSLALGPVCAQQDDVTPFQQAEHYTVVGTVQSVSGSSDRLVVNGSDFQRYVVDAYGADITLLDSHLGETSNLARGMRVRVVGTLLGRNLLEADRLRVLPSFAGAGPVDTAAYSEPIPAVVDPLPSIAAPILPIPVPTVATAPGPQFLLDGIVRDVDSPHAQITLLGDDDKRYTADTQDTDIILRGTERAGLTSDLTKGMRVHIVGVLLPDGTVEADRVRVLPGADVPVAPIAVPVPVTENMDAYTGILIDARSLPAISRSPAPAIYGTEPDTALLYPDRSHVPTPDEVQEESIVRYYWTIDSASSGVGGSNPLILTAQAVLGPAQDAVQLSPEDTARFQALDKRLHFTRTWKVGFLMPADH
ncbi:MAG: hypothetical protein ACRYFS_23720 [Janthinobacterium lividum]